MSQQREEQTIRAMVEIYCQAHHCPGELCGACHELFEYALARLGKCPFGPDKPVCAKCPIHCYRPDMRAQIREVMRFAGPRMMLKHPGLAISHLLQKRKPVPERRGGARPADKAAGESRCPSAGGSRDEYT